MKGQRGTIGILSQKMELLQKKKPNSQISMTPMDHSSKMLGNSKVSMKVKRIIINIQSQDEFFKELKSKVAEISANIKKGIIKPVDYATVSFPSLAEMRSTFTPNRLKLLSVIRHSKPGSVYELSKILDRDRRHIMKDINLLKNLGIIEVKRTKLNGRKVSIINTPFEEIDISLKI